MTTAAKIAKITQEEGCGCLWWDVPEPPGSKTEFKIFPQSERGAYTIRVTISWPVQVFNIGGRKVHLPHKEMVFFGSHEIIHQDLHIARSPAQVTTMVMSAALAIAQSLGPFLYAYDVRIGQPYSRAGLPRCPLLDPPRMFSPLFVDRPLEPLTLPCPLCKRAFVPGDNIMWGGGHLFWVHEACWVSHLPA